ncbi:MAG: TRAP transporter large permease subunit [Deltaproteobacteria bacterium]|nr:TRAP transporter large permease subunit [Deltaproteobacteria bacterium]
MKGGVARAESAGLVTAFLLAAAVPLVGFLGRPLGGIHLPGADLYLKQLMLWLTFLGGLVATRERAHLTLSTAELLGAAGFRGATRFVSSTAGATVCAALTWSSAQVVLADRIGGEVLPIGLPVWAGECVMPAALAVMAVRFLTQASTGWPGRLTSAALAAGVLGLGMVPQTVPAGPGLWLLIGLLLAATAVGAPVFAAMGGAALLLFLGDGTPVAAVSAEIFRLVESPTLPAIPLLTACGYVLAETNASHRLVRFFRSLFGWMPGGVAVLVTAVCALFTTFTGGSGVTIIALGGLVYPVLREEGYSEGFSLGLVTAAGSLGLLFPPSLPVILYSVVAKVPADSLYLAALVPGALLVLLVALYGVLVGVRTRVPRQAFAWREFVAAGWDAKWELSVPVVVVALFASGLASMVETAAAAFAYALVIECILTRDLRIRADVPRVLVKGGTLVGAVLILLASALGLTSYLVDAQVPQRLLVLIQSRIVSPLVFLLALNVFLLVLGSVLEIYAAIVVLAPLVAPAGAAFGVDPVHLGVIFLANLELGFLFPPAGLNLLLSSSRFGVPMVRVARCTLPLLAILAGGVIVITYVPGLSLGILRLFGRG